jgi:CTP synthase (UTP-ammonia lyase)
VITPLACSLVGQRQPVRIVPGTRTAGLYPSDTATEDYYCNYGVNPDWVERLESAGLRVSAVGEEDEVRVVELPAHPFFVATLFLPQARPPAAGPHPLLKGYAAAIAAAER